MNVLQRNVSSLLRSQRWKVSKWSGCRQVALNPIILGRDAQGKITKQTLMSYQLCQKTIYIIGQLRSAQIDSIMAQLRHLQSTFPGEPLKLIVHCHHMQRSTFCLNDEIDEVRKTNEIHTYLYGLTDLEGGLIVAAGTPGHRYGSSHSLVSALPLRVQLPNVRRSLVVKEDVKALQHNIEMKFRIFHKYTGKSVSSSEDLEEFLKDKNLDEVLEREGVINMSAAHALNLIDHIIEPINVAQEIPRSDPKEEGLPPQFPFRNQ